MQPTASPLATDIPFVHIHPVQLHLQAAINIADLLLGTRLHTVPEATWWTYHSSGTQRELLPSTGLIAEAQLHKF